MLGLPQLSRQSGWEVLVMSTGTYTYRTAIGVLTNARCQELIQDERQAVPLTEQELILKMPDKVSPVAMATGIT